ncbi:Holliday junction resolvase RuvX [Porticoccus sp.]
MPVTPDATPPIRQPRSLLAFDFGTGQIGVAVGQTLTHTANPLAVLKARDGIPDWQQIGQLLSEWQPDQLLVGLPLNMDGSESDFCQRARKFARRLHGRFGIAVLMVDERLTTFAAKGQQRDQGKRPASYRRQPVDDLAAAMILETWFSDPSAALAP